MWVDNRPEPKLKPGEWYHMETLIFGKGAIQQRKLRKVKAIKRYGDIWLFEDENGWKECWSLWEIARMM